MKKAFNPRLVKLSTPLFQIACAGITRRYPNWMPKKLNPNGHLILHEQDSAVDNHYEYAQFRDETAVHGGKRHVTSWYRTEIETLTINFLKKKFPSAKKISYDSSFEADLGVRFEDVLPDLNTHLANNLAVKNYPAKIAVEQQHREEYFKFQLTMEEAFYTTPTVGAFVEIYDNMIFHWVEKSQAGKTRTIPGHSDADVARESELAQLLDFYKATKYQGVEQGSAKLTDIFREDMLDRITEIPKAELGNTPLFIRLSGKVRELLKSGRAEAEAETVSREFEKSVSDYNTQRIAAEATHNSLLREGYTDVEINTTNLEKATKAIQSQAADSYRSQASKRIAAGGAPLSKQ